jgi:hypothetical protein
MLNIQDSIIAAIAYDPKWQTQEHINSIFESLKNNHKRSWFIDHAYHCLPLVMGNQYGIALKSLYDFEVIWTGKDTPESVIVEILNKEDYEKTHNLQSIKPHFGMGTFTVQTPYQLRTPNGINLMTMNPPNYFIDGLYHMTGVVETDNLRRDFTYNIRVTRPNYKIRVNKGDYIGCLLPYPRHFIDHYNVRDASKILTDNQITEERECARLFGVERSTEDQKKKHRNGKRYWRGEDIYSNKFIDHQTGLDK